MICEKWYVTKWCVKDGVCQNGVACQRCGVTKIVCDKVGKMVCEKVVGEKWCVTQWYAKLCVKDGG